jgi:3-phenylpropionate/trans-cinnamate dioxygenase ferredoxin reductase component
MKVIIIGAGQAGLQVALSLRQGGHEGEIMLFGDEPHLPYQRPPLSKAYLKGTATRESLSFRTEEALTALGLQLKYGLPVDRVDPKSKLVHAKGEDHHYDRLVIATGSRPRMLPVPGGQLDGVLALRGLDDADALKARLNTADNVVIIGGGFIGLETAATARAYGKAVTVVEATSRVMARAVSPEVSHWFEAMHRNMGTVVLTGVGVTALEGDPEVTAVKLSNGQPIPADMVLVGVGAVPNIELAAAAGLKCPAGIEVDAQGRTSDENIFAVGDCCSQPNLFAEGLIRLESVQNAIDQAKTVAGAILGSSQTYTAVPWFWSDQGDAKLQTTGLPFGTDTYVTRGDPSTGRFSVFHLKKDVIIAADSVNSPADHMAARRLVAAKASIPPEVLSNTTLPIKNLLTEGQLP